MDPRGDADFATPVWTRFRYDPELPLGKQLPLSVQLMVFDYLPVVVDGGIARAPVPFEFPVRQRELFLCDACVHFQWLTRLEWRLDPRTGVLRLRRWKSFHLRRTPFRHSSARARLNIARQTLSPEAYSYVVVWPEYHRTLDRRRFYASLGFRQGICYPYCALDQVAHWQDLADKLDGLRNMMLTDDEVYDLFH